MSLHVSSPDVLFSGRVKGATNSPSPAFVAEVCSSNFQDLELTTNSTCTPISSLPNSLTSSPSILPTSSPTSDIEPLSSHLTRISPPPGLSLPASNSIESPTLIFLSDLAPSNPYGLYPSPLSALVPKN